MKSLRVLEVYAVVVDYLDINIAADSKSKKFYVKAAENVEKLFVPFATCDDLIKMFEIKYSESPDDINLLKRIVKILDKKNVLMQMYIFEASKKVHEIEPSFISAYNMGNLSIKNKSLKQFLFAKQSLEISESDENKSNSFYGLSAAYFKSETIQLQEVMLKALKIIPKSAKVMILIGDIYAASANECGGNSFESAMLYSAAIDKFISAKNIDNNIADLANKKIASYSKYLPTKEDAFFNNYNEGDSYIIGCWINESTKVRIK